MTHKEKLIRTINRASRLSLLHTNWYVYVFDGSEPYYVISADIQDYSQRSDLVCCFYEYGVNLFDLVYFDRYEYLITDFIMSLPHHKKLMFDVWLKTQFILLFGYDWNSKSGREDVNTLYKEIANDKTFSLRNFNGADYEKFRELLIDDILDSESADLYISYNRENNTHIA